MDLFIDEAHTTLGMFLVSFPCMLPTPLCGIFYLSLPPKMIYTVAFFCSQYYFATHAECSILVIYLLKIEIVKTMLTQRQYQDL